MGPEEFRIGIKRFLEKYKYGSAVTADLWKDLEVVSSKRLNITKIMDTWTRQMGYPVLNVSNNMNNHAQPFVIDTKCTFRWRESSLHNGD